MIVMSPARVRVVIDKLEDAQFFKWSCEAHGSCSDSFITSLTVQRRRAINTVVDTGCDSTKPTLAVQAIELVMQAVGKNACSPMCSETPAQLNDRTPARASTENQNARGNRAFGAGDGIRTRDVNLGKVALYH